MSEISTSFCPVCGLRIFQKPEWSNLFVTDYYKVSFKIIGDSILYVLPEGNIAKLDIDIFYAHRQRIVDEVFGGRKYVEIRDFSSISGFPSKKSRLQQVDYLKAMSNQCLGFYGCNSSLLVKSVYNTGLIFNKTSYPIRILDTYKEAIISSLNILAENNLYFKNIDFDTFISKKAWNYENKLTGFSLTVKIISGIVFYTKQKGYFSEIDCPVILNIYEDILSNYLSNKDYYRISDYSEITGVSSKARRMINKSMLELNQKYSSNPRYTFVVGVNIMIKTSMIISAYFARYKINFVESFEKAKEFVEDSLINHERASNELELGYNKTFAIEQKDIDNLARSIGSIAWGSEDEEIESLKIPNDSPLRLVYEAFSLVHDDLRLLRNENEKLKNEIINCEAELEKFNVDKNKFFVNLSSEFRNPLNEIIANSICLPEICNDKSVDFYVKNISKSVSYISNYLDDMSDYSKIQTNDLILNLKPVNVNLLIEDIISNNYVLAKENKNSIQKFLKQGIPKMFLLDEKRLYNILEKLLQYALNNSNEGFVSIETDFVDAGNDSNVLILKLRDTGSVFLQLQHNSMFFDFVQTDNSLNEAKKKINVGILLAVKLINLMDGIIQIENISNTGSAIIIKFHNVSIFDELQMNGFQWEGAIDINPNFRYAKILLVEDDNNRVSFVNEVCKQVKLDVTRVSSIYSIFDELKKTNTNLIILDDSFKDIELSELVFRIKSVVDYEKVKIIVLSDKNNCSIINEINKSLIVDLLVKPISNKILIRTLMRILPFDLSQ